MKAVRVLAIGRSSSRGIVEMFEKDHADGAKPRLSNCNPGGKVTRGRLSEDATGNVTKSTRCCQFERSQA